jgi:hypothetical protein
MADPGSCFGCLLACLLVCLLACLFHGEDGDHNISNKWWQDAMYNLHRILLFPRENLEQRFPILGYTTS